MEILVHRMNHDASHPSPDYTTCYDDYVNYAISSLYIYNEMTIRHNLYINAIAYLRLHFGHSAMHISFFK